MRCVNLGVKMLMAVLAISVGGLVLSSGCRQAPGKEVTSTVTVTSTRPPEKTEEAKVFKWIIQTNYTADPKSRMGTRTPVLWEDVIKEVTGGRIQFNIAPPGSIVPVAESFAAVKSGTLDALVLGYPLSYSGIMPETLIEGGLPFAWRNVREQWHAWYDYGLLDLFREAYAEQNIYNLSFILDSQIGLTTKVPTYKPEDLKGKKIIEPIVGGDVLMQYLGAVPLVVPYTERYMAMTTGTADGIHMSVTASADLGITKTAKYYNVALATGPSTMVALINMKSWLALPADLREKVDKYSRYIETMTFALLDDTNYNTPLVLRKEGMTLIDWPEDVKANMAKYMIDSYWPKVAAKSPRNAKMIEIIKTQLRDLGRLQ